MNSYLGNIANVIKDRSSVLNESIVVLPTTKCIDEINSALMCQDIVLLAPQYYSYEGFVTRFSSDESKAYRASYIEEYLLLAKVLERMGVDVSLASRYLSQMESDANSRVREEFYKELKARNILNKNDISLDVVLGVASKLDKDIFIVPDIESDINGVDSLPKNIVLFDKPVYFDVPDLRLLSEKAREFAGDNIASSIDAMSFELLECANKIESGHIINEAVSALVSEGKRVVVVNDDVAFDNVCFNAISAADIKHKKYTPLNESHAYHLFALIVAFDFSVDNMIALFVNPVSRVYAPDKNISLLKKSGVSEKAEKEDLFDIIDSIDSSVTDALLGLQSLSSAKSFADAFEIVEKAFVAIVNYDKCPPVVRFEMNEFLKECAYYFKLHDLRYSDCFAKVLDDIASRVSYEVRTGSDIDVVKLSKLDFLDLSDKTVLLCDSGVVKLEQDALQDNDMDRFGCLCYRLIMLFRAQRLILIRNGSESEDVSIFYESVLHELKVQHNDRYHKSRAMKYDIGLHSMNQPLPILPIEMKPVEYYVSDIERLMNDPYAFYVHKVLNLRSREKLWEMDYNREFGNLLHYIISKLDWADLDSIDKQANEVFEIQCAKLKVRNPILDAWRERVMRSINFLIEYYAQNPVSAYLSEVSGAVSLDVDGVEISIKARADRVDLSIEGDAYVVDFKSGATPTQKSVHEGKKPQLAVESWMMSRGAFELKSDKIEAAYFSLSNKEDDQGVVYIPIKIDAVEESMKNLFRVFYASTAPYFATPYDNITDYIHIKRLQEWL